MKTLFKRGKKTSYEKKILLRHLYLSLKSKNTRTEKKYGDFS